MIPGSAQHKDTDAEMAECLYQAKISRRLATTLIPHQPNFVRRMALRCSMLNGLPSLATNGSFLELEGTALIPADWSYLTERVYQILPATLMLDIFDHAVMIAMEFIASETRSWRFIGWDRHCTPVIKSIASRHHRLCLRDEYTQESIWFKFSATFRRSVGSTWGFVREAEVFDSFGPIADFGDSVLTFVDSPAFDRGK
jgi:hypothetical protein